MLWDGVIFQTKKGEGILFRPGAEFPKQLLSCSCCQLALLMSVSGAFAGQEQLCRGCKLCSYLACSSRPAGLAASWPRQYQLYVRLSTQGQVLSQQHPFQSGICMAQVSPSATRYILCRGGTCATWTACSAGRLRPSRSRCQASPRPTCTLACGAPPLPGERLTRLLPGLRTVTMTPTSCSVWLKMW